MLNQKLESSTNYTSWCNSCHSFPSSVYCRADVAYLCRNCDNSIHSANSLARRHHRISLLPIAANSLADPKEEDGGGGDDKDGFFIGGDQVDEYLDLVEFTTSCEDDEKKEEEEEEEKEMMLHSFQLGFQGFKGVIDYTASVDQTESLSSMEATVVPENSMMSSISCSQIRTSNDTIELFSCPLPLQMPQQFTPMDREARVLRYREKRKTRKFQKVIRYASRKAYAETRPRIKGRFAKRTDAELEVDQMFASSVMVEASYGVVHSC